MDVREEERQVQWMGGCHWKTGKQAQEQYSRFWKLAALNVIDNGLGRMTYAIVPILPEIHSTCTQSTLADVD